MSWGFSAFPETLNPFLYTSPKLMPVSCFLIWTSFFWNCYPPQFSTELHTHTHAQNYTHTPTHTYSNNSFLPTNSFLFIPACYRYSITFSSPFPTPTLMWNILAVQQSVFSLHFYIKNSKCIFTALIILEKCHIKSLKWSRINVN